MPVVDHSLIQNILFDISKKKILPKFGNLSSQNIFNKNIKDIVTIVDIEVESALKNILTNILINSNFVGEESYTKNPKILKYYLEDKFCWTVDPIDGTKNYVNKKSKFAVMIALTKKNKIYQSYIYKPITEEFIYADLDQGTFSNNKKIKIQEKNDIKNSIGSISKKYWSENLENKILDIKKSFKKVNSYGSIGCEYLDIVIQKRDFTILSKLSPWDHIPGVFLIRQAGGNDCHFDKKKYRFFENSKNLIVSSSLKLNMEIINKLEE
tara:strand:- start:1619 stop:2419 length:801 start_codon:yes stop_codon:yes gene_type:complete